MIVCEVSDHQLMYLPFKNGVTTRNRLQILQDNWFLLRTRCGLVSIFGMEEKENKNIFFSLSNVNS